MPSEVLLHAILAKKQETGKYAKEQGTIVRCDKLRRRCPIVSKVLRSGESDELVNCSTRVTRHYMARGKLADGSTCDAGVCLAFACRCNQSPDGWLSNTEVQSSYRYSSGRSFL